MLKLTISEKGEFSLRPKFCSEVIIRDNFLDWEVADNFLDWEVAGPTDVYILWTSCTSWHYHRQWDCVAIATSAFFGNRSVLYCWVSSKSQFYPELQVTESMLL